MTKKVQIKYCVISACFKELNPGSKLETCETCRSNIHVWLKRRPAEVLERHKKLTKYSARMDSIIKKAS
jgi:hypothetical protein